MSWFYDREYIPVAQRRQNGLREARKLGHELSPVKPEGRAMAKSFWGKAWCANLDKHSDWSNRLSRGATYLRNGSVVDLQIEPGVVKSLVSGSELYKIEIRIKSLSKSAWTDIKRECSLAIESVFDLLQGKLDEQVMQRLTAKDSGMFPKPAEVEVSCSCPDYARICKHIAATFYGIGTRLDTAPELLFKLRSVDHLELIQHAASSDSLGQSLSADGGIAAGDLGDIFGIDLDTNSPTPVKAKTAKPRTPAAAKPSAAKTKAKQATKKAATKTTKPKSAAKKSARTVATLVEPKAAAAKPASLKTSGRTKTTTAPSATRRKPASATD